MISHYIDNNLRLLQGVFTSMSVLRYLCPKLNVILLFIIFFDFTFKGTNIHIQDRGPKLNIILLFIISHSRGLTFTFKTGDFFFKIVF